MYGYSFPQILAGLGTLGCSFAVGFGVFLKIVMPLVGARKTDSKSDSKFVSAKECQIRHEGNKSDLEKVDRQLSKLFDKSDETQKSVARIEGILTAQKQ